ncbi:MAG: NAD(P)H-binding protein [Candidatus Eisenbacteria bacterium]|nr:NAD(P)H-binding protein [Candidatus Eisenbacteria bacterium]
MTSEQGRIAIVGATGPIGFHLATELVARGRNVRVVSRSKASLEKVFKDENLEMREGDALDRGSIRRAVDGCDLIVDCIGLPAERMDDHPATARVIADVAKETGARCLQVSSYWSFLPHRGEVVDESHPRSGGHRWFQLRREAEDIFLASGAAVAHLPDFFGPRVHTSSVQMALMDAVAGRPMNWLGGPDIPREAAFVPDAMRIVGDLLEHEEIYGTNWAIPGNGTLTGRELARFAERRLGRAVKLRAVPRWILHLLSLVSSDLRAIRPLIPHYTRPVRYNTSKLKNLLGEIETKPMEDAVGKTIDSIVSEHSS